jgi:SAM-dependent MidA family methyltransferase
MTDSAGGTINAVLSGAMTPLEVEIRRRIAAAGPMPVAQYIDLCLTHPQYGYYITRDPLGVRGDFTTAPEVSQMFGELIGLWMIAVWRQMESPDNIRIIELGPGRGTMMADAMRAARVVPDFLSAATLHLVEISGPLRERQEKTLANAGAQKFWHSTLEEVPAGQAIIVANEYFDALSVNQAVKQDDGWHSRVIEVSDEGRLRFGVAAEPIPYFDAILTQHVQAAQPGDIFEWRSDVPALELGRRIAREPGAALIIDYGHTESDLGDTLQAVGGHAFADLLSAPGSVDLTAHVDFEALKHAAESMGAVSFGPIDQAQLLYALGIDTRAASLKNYADPKRASDIDAAVSRLTGRTRSGMGTLFKALALAHPSVGTPPAFG